jgi:hypothetical protein
MATAFNLGWDPEYLSYLLLALALARFRQPAVSAIALAAAITTNELTWVAVPIYLVLTLQENERWRRLLWLGVGLAIGILPWWLWDHALPTELLKFFRIPLFPGGQSIGALGVFPVHSIIYLVGMFLWVAACSWIAWKYPRWRWAMVAAVWGCAALSSLGQGYYFLPLFWLSPAVLWGAWQLHHHSLTPNQAEMSLLFHHP